MLRLAEDDCPAAESTASRSLQSGLDLYLRLRGLQLGAHAQPGGRSSGRVSPGRRVSGWAWIRPRGPEQSEINSLDITHDEKRQEKHRIHQFFSSLLESLGIPLPGETALVTAAAFAASGRLSIYRVLIIAAAAAILGDNGGYWIGRKGGLRLIRRYGRILHIDEVELGRARNFFDRHGGKTVFIGRFIALLRTWAAVLAGAARMSYGTFMLYNALGAVCWAVVVGALGYVFGRNLPQLEHYIGQASLAGALLVALVVGLVLAWRWFEMNRARLVERTQ